MPRVRWETRYRRAIVDEAAARVAVARGWGPEVGREEALTLLNVRAADAGERVLGMLWLRWRTPSFGRVTIEQVVWDASLPGSEDAVRRAVAAPGGPADAAV